MWGQLNMSCYEHSFCVRKCLVIIYVYLCLQAVSYDCTNMVTIQLHCNDLIDSEITL